MTKRGVAVDSITSVETLDFDAWAAQYAGAVLAAHRAAVHRLDDPAPATTPARRSDHEAA